MFEREWREMGFVPRWVIARTIQRQSIAEHSYFVVVYAWQIADYLGNHGYLSCKAALEFNYSRLLAAALFHEVEETISGDIPGFIKRNYIPDRPTFDAIMNQLAAQRFGEGIGGIHSNQDPFIRAIIKVADVLEETFFTATERQLGNLSLEDVRKNQHQRLRSAITTLFTTIFPVQNQEDTTSSMRRLDAINQFMTVVHLAVDNHQHGQSRIPGI